MTTIVKQRNELFCIHLRGANFEFPTANDRLYQVNFDKNPEKASLENLIQLSKTCFRNCIELGAKYHESFGIAATTHEDTLHFALYSFAKLHIIEGTFIIPPNVNTFLWQSIDSFIDDEPYQFMTGVDFQAYSHS